MFLSVLGRSGKENLLLDQVESYVRRTNNTHTIAVSPQSGAHRCEFKRCVTNLTQLIQGMSMSIGIKIGRMKQKKFWPKSEGKRGSLSRKVITSI